MKFLSAKLRQPAKKNAMRKKNTIIAILFFGTLFFFCAVQISKIIAYENSDFFQFWLGSRFLWEGKDPYDTQIWTAAHQSFGTERIAAPVYLYPLPLAILLAPLGALHLKTAFILWTFLSAGFLLISIILLLKSGNYKKTQHLLLPILLAQFLFRPATTTLLGGQLSSLYLLFAALAAYLWQKEKWYWGGASLALLAIKPSLGFPILLLAAIWLFARKKFTAHAGIASTGVLLLLVSLLVDFGWIPKYLHILSTKLNQEFGTSPTIWGFSALACHFEQNCTAWLGGIMLILFLALNIWLLSKRRFSSPIFALGHLIAIALLATLYLWPYDHLLLLIPVIYLMVSQQQEGVAYLKNSLLIIGISLASVLIRLAALTLITHEHKETIYGLLPLLVWGVTTWVLTKTPQPQGTSPSRPRP